MSEEIQTPIEAINEYYRLKDKYEKDYYEKYVKPIVNNDKSRREKRVEFSRLPKPECINCKRNVGTIFAINVNTVEFFRLFTAKCGDLSDPCPLDIQISYSIRDPLQKMITDGLTNIEKIKLEIIKQKNNALFFQTDENIISLFEKLTEELKAETENTGIAIETDILRNDNPVKANLLKKTMDEFGKGCILPFKEMIRDYLEKNDELILNQAVHFYVDEMIPKLKEIQSLKYAINYVEYNEEDGVYSLIQLPNSIESQEYWIEQKDKVVKFVRGNKKTSRKAPDEEQLTSKLKTKKNRKRQLIDFEEQEQGLTKSKHLGKKLELIEATEAFEELEEPGLQKSMNTITNRLSNEELAKRLNAADNERQGLRRGERERQNIPQDEPITSDTTGEIMWHLSPYNNIWKTLPSKLKTVLKDDPEWMKQFMFKCVNAKANGEFCKLTAPSNLLVPPNQIVLPNGEYDFGVPIYSEVFNKLSSADQQKYLSFFTTKDGIKQYNDELFKTVLNKQVAQELGFNEFS